MAAACFNGYNGLVSMHAYSLLQVVVVDGFKLLLLRNPWAQYEWKGAWSDGDAMWDKHPEVKKKLRPQFQDDGLFWMGWFDFCKAFGEVTVCEAVMRTGSAASEKKQNPAKFWAKFHQTRQPQKDACKHPHHKHSKHGQKDAGHPHKKDVQHPPRARSRSPRRVPRQGVGIHHG